MRQLMNPWLIPSELLILCGFLSLGMHQPRAAFWLFLGALILIAAVFYFRWYDRTSFAWSDLWDRYFWRHTIWRWRTRHLTKR